MHGCLGAKPSEAIGTMKYCAYKTGFCVSSVCISLPIHKLKLKRHTVDLLLLHNAHNRLNSRLGMTCPTRGVWFGVR